jgi:hypothetical protein
VRQIETETDPLSIIKQLEVRHSSCERKANGILLKCGFYLAFCVEEYSGLTLLKIKVLLPKLLAVVASEPHKSNDNGK